jgi:cold shock CspA family protein
VDDVAGVVHFDPPEDAATYVHRSGRTGRAGASGVVLSMVEPSARKAATTLQRKLGLPMGVGQPDITEVRELHGTAVTQEPRQATTQRHDGSAERTAAQPSSGGNRADRGGNKGERPRGDSGPRRGAAPAADDKELTGRVSHYEKRKGFGFIKVKGRDDVFVHMSGVEGEPAEILIKGNQVAFKLSKGRKGPVAVDVRPLSRSN